MLVNECRKGCDCIRQKYRVVQKIFMALIAKNRSLAFMTPWARRKDTISDCAATVGRAAEEALSNKVMPRGVTPTLSGGSRSEEHTSEIQSLMRISYAVFCLTKKKKT